MRVTPDTGILVRMNVRATGPARRLLDVILDGPHELVLSEFLLKETARVLRYPRKQAVYKLTENDISEHIELLRARSDLVDPVVHAPVVLADPNDDPVVYTAVAGGADVLCAMDRDFCSPQVISFCRERRHRNHERRRASPEAAINGESPIIELAYRPLQTSLISRT